MLTKKNFLNLALCLLIAALVIFVINYFFFHFVTDDGITLTWHPEAGKPFVADMIGNLGTLTLFGSGVSLLIALIFFKNEEK